MNDTVIPNCPHCQDNSTALKYRLAEDDYFKVVCDANPLAEGHILIIPHRHLPCVGAFNDNVMERFSHWKSRVMDFMNCRYEEYVIFEHGIVGQTVFHAHVHFVPATANIDDIITESGEYRQINSIKELTGIYNSLKKYLFLEIKDNLYVLNSRLGFPGFFRYRLADFLQEPHRGDWKNLRKDRATIRQLETDIAELIRKWDGFYT